MKRYYLIIIGIIIVAGLRAQSLDDYLLMAAQENPELKAKYNLYLAALEAVDQQAALPDPTLSFGYFISPVETRVGPQRFRLSLSQMFPWKGTIPLKKQAAAQMAQIRFEEFMQAKNRLFHQTRLKWLELYELEEEIRITEENLAILKTYEPVTKTKYEANLVSLSDLVRVQINIDEETTHRDLLILKKKPLQSDFNTLLNRNTGDEVLIIAQLDNSMNSSISIDSLLINQPALKAARLQIELADSQERLAGKLSKPNLGFGLDYAIVGRRTNLIIDDNGRDILMPMISMSLPVFGKKNRAAKKAAALKKESALAQLEHTENQYKNQWVSTDYKLEVAEKELDLYEKEIEKTNLLLRVLITEYTNNNREFEEVLATQQRLLALRLSEVRASVKYQSALFEQKYLSASSLNEFK